MLKLKTIEYYLDTKDIDQKKKYEDIKTHCKNLGFRKFHVISDMPSDLSSEVTVDESHIFDNQFNTVEGFRLFDWFEKALFDHRGNEVKNRKVGYYISGDVKGLQNLRRSKKSCGYCGVQYDVKDEKEFCDQCISSEYLTPDQLYMLNLQPMNLSSNEAHALREKTKDSELFKNEYEKGREILKIKKAERLKKKALSKIEDLKHSTLVKKYENDVQVALLENGQDTDNLIYYSHTGEWCLGWRNKITEKEKLEFQDLICRLDLPADPQGISMQNIMRYEVNNAKGEL